MDDDVMTTLEMWAFDSKVGALKGVRCTSYERF
jgi:hypothetical protein